MRKIIKLYLVITSAQTRNPKTLYMKPKTNNLECEENNEIIHINVKMRQTFYEINLLYEALDRVPVEL